MVFREGSAKHRGSFASSVGAVPPAVVSGASVTYLALAIVAAALALATIPAILGASIHPAAALREA
jgi:hypothetical protein